MELSTPPDYFFKADKSINVLVEVVKRRKLEVGLAVPLSSQHTR